MSHSKTLSELAQRLDAEVAGDGERVVTGVRPLDEAGPQHLSFLHNRKYLAAARQSQAGAILVADRDLLPGRDLLVTPEPYLALARALEILSPPSRPDPGVHPSAVIAEEVQLGDGVSVGAQAVIGRRTSIGAGTVIGPGCVLGEEVQVGASCLLFARVVVGDRCQLGDRCIMQPGVIIGSDGFGFATVAGVHHKVPQVGLVVIEDDVELGANVCVDRGTLGETRIGRGTKVDNLVQIAHNVTIGEGTILVAQVGLSGSTQLGHHVVMAGQSGAAGHLTLGDRAMVGAKSAVFKDVPAGVLVTGIPAQPHRQWLKVNANLRRLESLRERVGELEEALAELEGREGK